MGYRVMIVEDSPVLRAVMRRAVEQSGIGASMIREAGNGHEALAALEAEPVDLILLDLNMPVMDGFEFAREKAGRPAIASIPVVAVTTEGNRKKIDGLRSLGIEIFLRKPFAPQQLRDIVASLRTDRG